MDREPVYTTDYSASLFDDVMIAAPCNVGWENMKGDDRVRFCGQCELNVYNTSVMTPAEINDLLSLEGSPCLRLFRRADGTLITENCPVGLRKIRDGYRKLARVAAAVWALLVSVTTSLAQDKVPLVGKPAGFVGLGLSSGSGAKNRSGKAYCPPFQLENAPQSLPANADGLALEEFHKAQLAVYEKRANDAYHSFRITVAALKVTRQDPKFVQTVYTDYARFLKTQKFEQESKNMLIEMKQVMLRQQSDSSHNSQGAKPKVSDYSGVPYQTSPDQFRGASSRSQRHQRTAPTLPGGAPVPENE